MRTANSHSLSGGVKHFIQYPVHPGTTPAAGPDLPNIFRRSSTSASGCSYAAKCPPASCSDSNTIFPLERNKLCAARRLHQPNYGQKEKSRNARFRELDDFFGEEGQADWDGRLGEIDYFASVCKLVIDSDGCCGAGAREPVNRDPCEHFENQLSLGWDDKWVLTHLRRRSTNTNLST